MEQTGTLLQELSMTHDPFDAPAGEVDDPSYSADQFAGRFPAKKVFDGEGFFNWLNKTHKTHLWVMTYTASFRCELDVPISCLLVNIGEYPAAEKTRKLKGIHTKLYIQWLDDEIVGAYLGSQNLVLSSHANLMCALDPSCYSFAERYFLHYWKQGKDL